MKPERQNADQRMEESGLNGMFETIFTLCRDCNLSISEFYDQKRSFSGSTLADRNQFDIGKRYPQTTPLEVERRIIELSDLEPLSGCGQIEQQLNREGKHCSKPTIQKILERNGRGTRYDRLLLLESRYLDHKAELTPKQMELIEKINPCFRERGIESQRPGEILCQDVFPLNGFGNIGKVYLHTVVDTFCSFAFASLHATEPSLNALGLLRNRVLPFYLMLGLDVSEIRTGGSRIFSKFAKNPYHEFMRRSGIKHVHEHRVLRKNGFSERFQATVTDEFFKAIPRAGIYCSISELQKDLDTWLYHYNHGRPNRGYRNMGQKPYESIIEYLDNLT